MSSHFKKSLLIVKCLLFLLIFIGNGFAKDDIHLPFRTKHNDKKYIITLININDKGMKFADYCEILFQDYVDYIAVPKGDEIRMLIPDIVLIENKKELRYIEWINVYFNKKDGKFKRITFQNDFKIESECDTSEIIKKIKMAHKLPLTRIKRNNKYGKTGISNVIRRFENGNVYWEYMNKKYLVASKYFISKE